MNYKIAICDDEQTELAYLSSLVGTWTKQSDNVTAISVFDSAEAFLFDYALNKDYDILLLDIEMKVINGIELAKQIRVENNSVQIVFITGYPDFIAEGYEVSALHYLLKPVIGKKLSEVLDRAAANLRKNERIVLFNVDGETIRVPVDKVMFAEAFAHSVVINTIASIFEVKLSITDTEKLLSEGFIRCHRSYLVGLKFINSISRTEITLDTGEKLPLSRSNYQKVNQAFIRYFRGD